MKFALIFAIVLCGLCACGPDPVSPTCEFDAIDHLGGIEFTGHITLCNAQGSSLRYEPGKSLIELQNGKLYYRIESTNNGFVYTYTDSASYQCIIQENKFRNFDLYNLNDSIYMGTISDTKNRVHFLIIDSACSNSSFFEGAR